ncbi:Mitogen-activated protein kinase kinase [Actinidia chinensis var. chinensis]|uniref:Mitogen-activated protein kinase kinase n=1 Tax=Actinidia chinensis var. chinensis TaxID=1590841 RepID=A0A2R6QD97_ACTCC|nr:Mitogen-activated protein kinase kinase [Actinidia chinensis var. chinensis]
MEWSRGPTIGRGSSATVSLAASTSGDHFAVKSAELSLSSSLQREQHILSQLNSPQIVQYLGFEITHEINKPTYNLFIEYLPSGTISDSIKKQGGSIDESLIRFYTHQIVLGLIYLHSNGLVHCDIKGQNLLICKDGVKIADLGSAKWVKDRVATSAFSGTPAFMAPEVARGEEQGFPADVWALGCTIIEMATGSHPWPEENDPVSALYRIGFSGDVPATPDWFSGDARDFLAKCLKKDPRERWTVNQLLEHPFLRDLESNSPEGIEFHRNSPTSVLDQAIWDSMEVSESHRNPTHMSFSSNSPAERIRRLIGETFSLDSNFPNWTSDEDWVTVRNRDIDETIAFFDISTNGKEIIDAEWDFIWEDVVDSIVVTEDLLPEISVGANSDVDCLYGSTDFVMLCECVVDANVPGIYFTLKRQLMEILLLFNLIVLLIVSPHLFDSFMCLVKEFFLSDSSSFVK